MFLIVPLLILLICSALISGAEVALFSLEASDLEEGKTFPGRDRIIKLLDRPKKTLATILVANNAINIAIVLLFDSLGAVWFGSIENEAVRFAIEVGLVTFMILLFGEILPKVYASRNKVKFSGLMAVPLSILDVIFSPISLPMRNVIKFIHNKLGSSKSSLSVTQLSQALALTDGDDTTIEEQRILKGIVAFGATDAREVMRPRMDIVSLEESLSIEEVIEVVIQNSYSRLPVYKENQDQITGVLVVKDLLPFLGQTDYDWTQLLRKAPFIPENKKLDDLLREFQEEKVHLAIVVDEYGGTSGIITLEDIIEEIVGDISDEFDDEDLFYSKLDDNNYVFDGKTPLKNFLRIVTPEGEEELWSNARGEAETIAGFLLEISGNWPRKGEKIKFEKYTFTVESMEQKRIKQIKITRS